MTPTQRGLYEVQRHPENAKLSFSSEYRQTTKEDIANILK